MNQLKAGPELDAAVDAALGGSPELHAILREEPPQASRSISNAWEVVQAMRDRGYWVDLQSSGLHPELWKVTIQKSHGPTEKRTKKFVEAAFGAPEAICLAVLSALSSFPDSTKEGEK